MTGAGHGSGEHGAWRRGMFGTNHIAGSATKYMGNGAQHGIAVAVAAHLCIKHGTSREACSTITSTTCNGLPKS